MQRLTLAGLTLALVAGLVGPTTAQADETWLLTLEPAFTTPLTDPQNDQYGPGGSLAIGAYRSLAPWVLIGARLRGSIFDSGAAPENPLFKDQPAGGLYTLSAALRFRIASGDDPRRGTGPYLELAGGPGLTDDLIRGTVEAGIGWNFEAGAADLGPVIRYQHVFHDDVFDNGPLQPDDAHLLLVGLEVVLFDERPAPPAEVEPEPAPERPCAGLEEDVDGFEDEDGCPDPDNDRDGILDVDDACPMEPETYNGVNDHDGCPDSGQVEIIDDRVVIQEDVFFDFDEAELKPQADAIIRQVVALWDQHPEWVGVIVEGHADARGTREYNQGLSERRAEAVKRALVAEGMADPRVATEGYGEMRPRFHNAETEAQHAINRRVEFVVVQATPAEASAEAEAATQTPTEDE
ncbi:MAG: hypothetical protein CMN30_34075 [Sandaracinus sp.]|nr:hypothetical protein [Sandaracinus sp.]|tara:strand:+ start:5458 stop:6678 length:1221 start_codon:yes stop_codon:yes gene_type:complete